MERRGRRDKLLMVREIKWEGGKGKWKDDGEEEGQ